ncbi:MAG TPA: glycosyltransferase, partial [Herpetosiphonaceae bacterium]
MSRPLRIAMVAHTLNHNNIGRVYPFLQAFAGSALVEPTLIGWDETGELFPLLRDAPCPVVRLSGPATGPAAVRQLQAAFSGADVVHCFKNRSHFRSALAAAAPRRLPLVLDLDDWELGLYLEGASRWPRWRQWLWGGPMARRIGEALELERLARTAPAALLVNSGALKAHFGGEIVYTSADAAQFDPALSEGAGFRAAHGLPAAAPVIGFLGTPHPHKGIDELLAAFAAVRAATPATRLLFVGVPAHNPYRARLLAAEGVSVVDYIAAGDYPAAYAACDVLA